MLGRTLKGTGIVALGTAIGQATVLVATPFLARLYTPADFGALAMLTTVSNIATAVACLRYDLALPSAGARDAAALLRLAALCAAGSALLAALGLWLLGRQGSITLAAPLDAAWLVGLCVVLAGWQQAAIGMALRERAYHVVGAIRLVQGLAFSALATLPFVGLVLGHALSFVASLAVPLRRRRSPDSGGAVATLRQIAIEYRGFPLQSLPGAVLDVVGYSLCIWLLSAAYGAAEAGQYAQVQRLVGAPLMLVSLSVGQVMLRQTADFEHRPEQLRRFILRILAWLVLLSFTMLALIALAGEPLLRWLLGAQWRVDNAFVMPIAIAVFVRACVSPLTSVLITLRRFDLALRWQTAYFLSACTLLATAAFQLPLDTFVLAYAAHECVFYGAYLALVARAIR